MNVWGPWLTKTIVGLACGQEDLDWEDAWSVSGVVFLFIRYRLRASWWELAVLNHFAVSDQWVLRSFLRRRLVVPCSHLYAVE